MDLQTLLALGVLSFDALNAYINNLPRISTRLADMRLFQEDGLVGRAQLPRVHLAEWAQPAVHVTGF